MSLTNLRTIRRSWRAVAVLLVLASLLLTTLLTQRTVSAAPSSTDMFAFVLSGDYEEVGGVPTAAGSIKNGNVGAYPEGSCIPVLVEATNGEDEAVDLVMSPVYDYFDTAVGIEDLEVITTDLAGNPRDSVDNLNDFAYPETSLTSAASFATESGATVSTTVTGPFAGDDDSTTPVSPTDAFRHFNMTIHDVPAGDTVYVLFCGRLGIDAGEYSGGASLSIRLANGGNENIPIPVNQLQLLPSLTLTKMVDGGDALPSDFSFVVSPAIDGVTDFSIPLGESSVVIENVSPDGDYTVVELGPDGYEFVSGAGTNCVFVGDIATATVAAAKNPTNAECIFTNGALDLPTLTVIKEVVNDDGGTAVVSDFTLYVDDTVVVSGETNAFAPGDYTVSEDPVDGYTGTISGDCAADGSITIEFEGDYTCTITNDDDEPTTGTITVIKEVVNDDDGTAEVADFILYVDDTVVVSGESNEFPVGDYTISEDQLDGYNATFSGDCAADGSLTLAGGEDLVCTITNDDIPPTTGTIRVIKEVVNDDGGTAVVDDFILYVDDTVVVSGESNVFEAGDYTVSEDQLDGYTATFSGDCADDGSLTLAAGESLTCTITNDDILFLGSITVIKEVVNDDDATAEVSDFTLYVDDVVVVSGETNEFQVGDYVVSEDQLDGYTATFSGDCDDQGNLTLGADEDLVCTITNDDIPPSTGTITVIKEVVNDDGGTAVVADFTLYVDDTVVVSGEANVFDPGDYTVSEDQLDGYTATFSGDCGDDGSITLEAGDSLTCTITNDDDVVLQPTCSEDGNILLNGGFEAVDDRAGAVHGRLLNELTSWDVYGSLPDVTDGSGTSWYRDNDTAGIEVQYDGVVVSPQEGSFYIELDSHASDDFGSVTNSSVSQDVILEGGDYTLEFFYRPRRDTADDSIAEVYVDGVLVHTSNSTDTSAWIFETVDLPSMTAGAHTITFTGAGIENAHGAFIDTVELFCGDGDGHQPETGTITVIKEVINDDGGDAEVSDFTLYVNGEVVVSGESNEFDAGDYVISEDQDPDYDASFSGDCDANGNLTLAAGEDLTCTITNNDEDDGGTNHIPETGHITVIKEVINDDGGDAEVSDFPLYVNQTLVTSGDRNEFNTGTYTIWEEEDSDYTATFSGDCDSDGVLILGDNEDLTCVITNDDKDDGGTNGSDDPDLTVYLVIINDDGGDFSKSDFELYVDDSLIDEGVTYGMSAGTSKVTWAYVGDPDGSDEYTDEITGDCDTNGDVTMIGDGSYECTIIIDDDYETGGGRNPREEEEDDGGDPDPTPEPEVLGEVDEPEPAPEPEVLGAVDELPLTGTPAAGLLIGLGAVGAYVARRRKQS